MMMIITSEEQKRLAHDIIETCGTHIYIMPALFMMSQTQTARHRLVALAAVTLRLSNVSFERTRTRP